MAQRLGVGEARRQLQLGQALLDMGAGGVASREDLLGRGALLDHHVHELVEEAVHHRRDEAGRNQALVLGPRDLGSTQLDAIAAGRVALEVEAINNKKEPATVLSLQAGMLHTKAREELDTLVVFRDKGPDA